MNNTRRKTLEVLRDKIADIQGELESLRDEEQEYFDNMPESLQGGDKGEAASAACTIMEEAIESLGAAVETLTM